MGLIRFGGHAPKGGYDVQNGIKQSRKTRAPTVHGGVQDRRSPARLCRSGGGCTVRVHAFLRPPPPRWAFSSPGPRPHQGSFPKKSGCHDHISPSLRTTCRTAAASPRPIPRNAGAQINQAAGHAVIWGGTLGVRRDAQGARDGELSVPRRRRPVCAIDHILKNRKHLTRIELTNTTTITEVMEWS